MVYSHLPPGGRIHSHAPKREKRFREINGEVVLSRSALSRCVDRMAASGLVEKLDCQEDPRGLIVRITDQGEQELKRAWPIYRRLIESLFGRHFTADELEFLAKRFANVTSHLISQEISGKDAKVGQAKNPLQSETKETKIGLHRSQI
jgi:DNA-binding MarR family transcriptional regulator